MKIQRIRVYEVALGMALGSYTSAKGTISALTTSIIAVDTDEGVTGWGEVCPYGANYLPGLHSAVVPVLAELAPQFARCAMTPSLLSKEVFVSVSDVLSNREKWHEMLVLTLSGASARFPKLTVRPMNIYSAKSPCLESGRESRMGHFLPYHGMLSDVRFTPGTGRQGRELPLCLR